ncbi:MAG: SDR family NAD(P)-dependent oxidoreductase [Raoultibacter sp.]
MGSNWFSKDPKEHLAGKTAIVMGGGSGIGKAAAQTLAAAGANLVIAGIPEAPLHESVEEIKAEGGNAIAVLTDGTKMDQLENLVNTTVKEFGGLDIVVSSAGIAIPRANSLDVKKEDWDRIFSINLDANFFLAQAAGRVMKDNPDGGQMVFVSSQRGISAMENIAPYSITKAAVMGMVRSLAIDFAQYQICVNGIAPGYVMTDIVRNVFKENPAQEEYVYSRTPLKKLGTLDDMAAAILLLCLPQASYTTGQTLILDGGWSVQ